MAGFVVGDNFFFFFINNFVFFFQFGNDVVGCIVEVFYFYLFFVLVGGNQCCFIVDIGDICIGEVWSLGGQSIEVDIVGYSKWFGVYFKNGFVFGMGG